LCERDCLRRAYRLADRFGCGFSNDDIPLFQQPKIDRVHELRLQGDWRMAIFHRVGGWLVQEIGPRSAPKSKFPVPTNPNSGLHLVVGDREIALFNIAGEIYAMDGLCCIS
jgi:hypothetical protein